MKNRIKIERAILDITQEELANRIGVSRQTVNSIEKNRYVPSTVLALKISKIFEKTVNEIFELEETDWPLNADYFYKTYRKTMSLLCSMCFVIIAH